MTDTATLAAPDTALIGTLTRLRGDVLDLTAAAINGAYSRFSIAANLAAIDGDPLPEYVRVTAARAFSALATARTEAFGLNHQDSAPTDLGLQGQAFVRALCDARDHNGDLHPALAAFYDEVLNAVRPVVVNTVLALSRL